METKLKPYMGYVLDEPCEGAILIFASNSREAKKVGWGIPSFIHDMANSYIDFRVRFLKDSPYLFKYGNQEKLRADISHIIETPVTCKGCDLWGEDFNKEGFCQSCWEDECEEEWIPK